MPLLSAMPRWKSPFADGMCIRCTTFPDPPDWPKIVTLPASPPNAPTLACTHRSAASMSAIPVLPAWVNSGPYADRLSVPSTLSRWLSVTTTTSPNRLRCSPS